nr:hypothetical protein [Tanacetum cinerariifolium]
MRDFTAYKTNPAYATGAASPKMKRKFKKHASPLKKRTLVTVEEEEPEPAKKGDSEDEDVDDQQSDDERKEYDDEQTKTNNSKTSDDEQETQDDEFVHSLEDYVPTDDEKNDESNDVTEEEYERINEELYGDVNVILTDAEHVDKEKDDEEMTVAGHMNVNQEGAARVSESGTTVVQVVASVVVGVGGINCYREGKSEERREEIFVTEAVVTVLDGLMQALYHALIESILEDEDAMDEGVADKLKKRKLDDANKDEGPSVGSERGLKRKKTSKDTETSKKSKSTESSKGTSKSQPKSTSKPAQAEETMFEAEDT